MSEPKEPSGMEDTELFIKSISSGLDLVRCASDQDPLIAVLAILFARRVTDLAMQALLENHPELRAQFERVEKRVAGVQVPDMSEVKLSMMFAGLQHQEAKGPSN